MSTANAPEPVDAASATSATNAADVTGAMHAPGGAGAAWWREPSRGQWMSFFAAWFGWVLDAFDFTVFLLVMPQIAKDFRVTITATAWTVTLTLLLRLVGGVVAGAAADRWGRKLPLMLSVVWFAACDGAVAFAPSFTWVLVLRTLFGLGMGAEWASGATLAMENWPVRSRGIASGVLQGSWAIGYLLASVVSGAVLRSGGTWRTLFLLAALPAILVLPIRIWVPESLPERRDRARADVAAARVERARVLRTIGWGSFFMALAFSAYYGITALYPTFLIKELKLAPGDIGTLVALFNVGMLAGAIACGYLAARWSPIGAIMVCALMTLPILPFYVGWVPGWSGWLYVGAVLGGVFGGGYAGVTPLLLTAIFPAHLRARSVGFVYHIGACFAAFVPTIIASLVERVGLDYAHAIALVTGGFQLALAVAIVFRPRNVFEAADPVAPPPVAAAIEGVPTAT